MIKRLTQHQLEIITDLWQAVDGQAHVFVPADTLPYSPLYWLAHECRGLITLRKTKRKGKVYRKIALTENGVIWCSDNGIYARESIPESLMPLADKRQRTTISFQVGVDDDLAGQVGECKKRRDFIPMLRLGITLYQALGYAGFQALTQSTLNNLEVFQMSPDEIAAAYMELEAERQRLAFERAALEAQTLEVKQFHDMFRDIDAKLSRLQSGVYLPNNGVNSSEPPVQREKVHDDGTDSVELNVTRNTNAGQSHMHEFLKAMTELQKKPDQNTKPVTNDDAGLFVVTPQPAPVPSGIRKLDTPVIALPDDDIEIEW